MGHSDTATASVGYRVTLRDLIESIHDEESCSGVYVTLNKRGAFLEDDNNEDNHAFMNIVYELEEEETWESTKERWMSLFRPYLNHDLLIPMICLGETTRWGYSREGVNGIGTRLSVDQFSEKLRQLQETCPPHHSLTWIICQGGY